jgi:acyl-CoA hydrolase
MISALKGRLKASLNYVGKTSMLVGVKVFAENPFTGIARHTTTAYLVFVALDDIGKPIQVRGVIPAGDEEQRRFDEGKHRIEEMKKNKKKD